MNESSCCFTYLLVFGVVHVLGFSLSNRYLEKAMAPHSSTLAWKIPWTEEPGRLQSMGLLSVGHDWATSLSLFTFMHWRRKWQPTPVFSPGESQRREPGGLLSMGLHRVGRDWSDLAAAAAAREVQYNNHYYKQQEYRIEFSHMQKTPPDFREREDKPQAGR